jgi:hypothetical protein
VEHGLIETYFPQMVASTKFPTSSQYFTWFPSRFSFEKKPGGQDIDYSPRGQSERPKQKAFTTLGMDA